MINYLITGGGFANKGAESMLYTLISELKAKSDCNIIVQVVHGFEFVDHDVKGISFIPLSYKERKKILNPVIHTYNMIVYGLNKVLGLNKKKNLLLYKAIRKSDVVIDISGYSLSSQWDPKAANHIPQTIKLAKKYNKKVILLPQSFGPLEFPKKYNLSKKYLKRILSYPEAIFCREQDGYDCMKAIGLSNVFKSHDIVIQSTKSINFRLTKKQTSQKIVIKEHSVLIVPNIRVFERTNKNEILKLYEQTINFLLKNNYNVYLTYYDLSDFSICKEIKNIFENEPKVVFIENNLNCIDFDNLLLKFDFIISSRFHSIVHAYKHGIPAVVIGWAIKYKELLESVNQQSMLYDGRIEISQKDFLNSIKYLIKNRKKESNIIKENVKKIQKKNCFDKMWEFI